MKQNWIATAGSTCAWEMQAILLAAFLPVPSTLSLSASILALVNTGQRAGCFSTFLLVEDMNGQCQAVLLAAFVPAVNMSCYC